MARAVVLIMMWLPGCGGVASIDLTFLSGDRPEQNGTMNLAVSVLEGSGSAATIIEEHVEPFDRDFDLASIRIPFGAQRSLVATIETAEARPRVVFSGRSGAFRLEEGDGPRITVVMFAVPTAGSGKINGAANGWINTATVTVAISERDAFGVNISDEPSFSPNRTDTHRIADLPSMSATFPLVEVSTTYVFDSRCEDRAGCPRTLYLRLFDQNGFTSEVFTVPLIYDPFPPRLLQASIQPASGAVLGGTSEAVLSTVFDEAVVVSAFASLSSGSSPCPSQVELVDQVVSGFEFGADCAGTYSIELTATDLAGNTVRLLDVDTLAVDRAAPPPIDLAFVEAGCVGRQRIVRGLAGAAEARAIIDASNLWTRADDQGAFVINAEMQSVLMRQVDAAGNESAPVDFEVAPCGG